MLRLILPNKHNALLYILILALISIVVGFELYVLEYTHGTFLIPHEEAYLNYTIAKTLAYARVWGISRYQVGPLSPSLLFPIALVIPIFIFGPHLIMGVIINTLGAIYLQIKVQKWLTNIGVKKSSIIIIQLWILILIPLPLLVIQATEQLFQLLFLTLLLIQLQIDWQKPIFSKSIYWYASLLVAANVLAFMTIVGISIYLVIRKRPTVAKKIVIYSTIPVVLFIVLVALNGAYNYKLPMASSLDNYRWMVGAVGILVVPLTLKNHRPGFKWAAAGTLAVGAIVTLNVNSLIENAQSSIQLYEGDWQLAKFTQRFYKPSSITMEGINTISWLTEGKKLDLSYLPHNNSIDSHKALITRQYMLIGIFSPENANQLPATWQKTADWQTIDPETRASKHTLFYAVDSFAAVNLKENLQEYRPLVKGTVNIEYYYRK